MNFRNVDRLVLTSPDEYASDFGAARHITPAPSFVFATAA
jgi:hypothetical protein